ncbi:D-alanyl-D-alanine carboxypeptidase family protein [Globicatella sulfidifaciens]
MKMINKILILLLSVFLVLPKHSLVSAQELNIENLPAKSMMLINGDNGQVLFNKNSEVLLEIGSLSKLLLLYIVFEQIETEKINLDDIVPISNSAYELSQDYDIPNVPLRQDFSYTVEELITAIAVKNANGAALALVEKIASNEADFIKLMEQKLSEWQLSNYQFVDSLGLPNDYEIGVEEYQGQTNKMSAEAITTVAFRLYKDYPQYLEYASTKELNFKADTDDAFQTTSNNPLLKDAKLSVNGMFIGYAPQNGYNQVISSSDQETTYLAVVIGVSENQEDPYYPVEQLIQYAKSSFDTKIIVKKESLTDEIPVINVDGGTRDVIHSVYTDDFVLSVPKGDNQLNIDYQFIPNEEKTGYQNYITAPIDKGDFLGTLKMDFQHYAIEYLPTAQNSEVQVVANESIPEKSIFGKFLQSVMRFIITIIEAIRKFFTNIFN